MITELLDELTFIENVQQVVDEVMERHKLKVTGSYVR